MISRPSCNFQMLFWTCFLDLWPFHSLIQWPPFYSPGWLPLAVWPSCVVPSQAYYYPASHGSEITLWFATHWVNLEIVIVSLGILTAFLRSHLAWLRWRLNCLNFGRTTKTRSLYLSCFVEVLNLSTCSWRTLISSSQNTSFPAPLLACWDVPVSWGPPPCMAAVESTARGVVDEVKEDIWGSR